MAFPKAWHQTNQVGDGFDVNPFLRDGRHQLRPAITELVCQNMDVGNAGSLPNDIKPAKADMGRSLGSYVLRVRN